MDISLARTFLAVVSGGSFVAAARQLHLTQSAVSLRVQKLEQALGRAVFVRSRAGAELTAAGREFQHYARVLVHVWEEARQQVALPADRDALLVIGGQYSLWPRLGLSWLNALERALPRVALRAEAGVPERLSRLLLHGSLDMALVSVPQLHGGLVGRALPEEQLVLVAAWPDPQPGLDERYVYLDWGEEFARAHALHFADLAQPPVQLSLGMLALEYVIEQGKAAYFPAWVVGPQLQRGVLHRVPEAPLIPLPVWVVWRAGLDAPLRDAALEVLDGVTARLATEQARLAAPG